MFEAFKRLRPGVVLKCLHGRMKQMKRLQVFYEFCEAKQAVLFATDVAARGLDFPTVDWVVQVRLGGEGAERANLVVVVEWCRVEWYGFLGR